MLINTLNKEKGVELMTSLAQNCKEPLKLKKL
jgi:hypothetical protein